ncbi:MAG TPA: CoA transferase [Acidimicrobiia bacterium]|nr:CoA transferase [Acidimicrobiia bacterium]
MPGPICEGLTVVELGSGSIAASLAGMILADNGARVVKIEPPGGDALRRNLPSGFLVWNRGKESAVHDLHIEDGRRAVRDLAARADVLLVGFGAGRAEEWGLGYDAVHPSNPGLVYCAITGFGPAGPYANLKAYEGVVQAKLGAYTRGIFGFRDGPIFSGAPTASTGAAHMAVSGILAALIARETTGRGQRVDTSLAQGLIPADYFGIYHAQLAMRAASAGASDGPNTAPGGGMGASRYALTLPTKDGRWVNLSPQQPHQAAALLRAVGLDHTLEQEPFANAPFFKDADDAQAWEDMLWEKFRAQTWAELQPQLIAENDLPFELCGTSEEALDHPQIVANGEAIEVDDPVVGTVRQVGPVAAFAKSPSVVTRSAPALGEGTGGAGGEPVVMDSGASLEHALSGVTIVEFGFFYAMPFGVTLAASLGARVIKLEDGHGDPMRQAFGGESGSAKVTEGKESLSIDLKSERGRAIVQQVVERADVFVLGFRPGVAERLGIDYESLAAVNPDLVYVHAAGYGAHGPYAHRPVYASTALALAGNLPRHAGFWMNPELSADFSVVELQNVIAPRLRGPIDGDSNAAQTACTALMLGLFHQRRTGEGQFLATSMIGGNVYSYSDDAVTYAGKPPVPQSDPEQHGLSALYRLYEAADGWIFLAAVTREERDALARALQIDLPDGDDERAAVIAAAVRERKADELEQMLTDAGAGAAAVAAVPHPAVVATDPVLLDTGLAVDIEHPLFGVIRRHGLPAALSETPGRVAAGCSRGEHTRAILAELGYSPDDVAGLERDGVVFGPD